MDFDKTLIKKHELEVGTFHFFKNYMVAKIKERIVFSIENATEMLQLAKEYYGNTIPFVYITNGINSYSFNPTHHFKIVAMFPNLQGYATVTYDSINHEIAKMEEAFMLKPTGNFANLEQAIEWAKGLIPMD